MEIREIFDTIESDSNMDKDLQNNILESLNNIANADKLVDGLEEKIEEHRHELSEKELKYIINKCISYKSVFYRFRNGGIVDFDQLNEITKRIFALEQSIRQNDFTVWKEELLAYKGSKEDKAEDKMLKNMLMVVPEESNIVDKITRMFKRTLWKVQQKAKQAKAKKEEEVIELPSTSSGFIDLELPDGLKDENTPSLAQEEPQVDELNVEETVTAEVVEENVQEVVEEAIEESTEEATETVEEKVEEPTEEAEATENEPENETEVEVTKEAEVTEDVVPEETTIEVSEEVQEKEETNEVEEEKPKGRRGARTGAKAQK